MLCCHLFLSKYWNGYFESWTFSQVDVCWQTRFPDVLFFGSKWQSYFWFYLHLFACLFGFNIGHERLCACLLLNISYQKFVYDMTHMIHMIS